MEGETITEERAAELHAIAIAAGRRGATAEERAEALAAIIAGQKICMADIMRRNDTATRH
jgi:hypothetical protein